MNPREKANLEKIRKKTNKRRCLLQTREEEFGEDRNFKRMCRLYKLSKVYKQVWLMYNDALLIQHASANNNTRIGESSSHTVPLSCLIHSWCIKMYEQKCWLRTNLVWRNLPK